MDAEAPMDDTGIAGPEGAPPESVTDAATPAAGGETPAGGPGTI